MVHTRDLRDSIAGGDNSVDVPRSLRNGRNQIGVAAKINRWRQLRSELRHQEAVQLIGPSTIYGVMTAFVADDPSSEQLVLGAIAALAMTEITSREEGHA